MYSFSNIKCFLWFFYKLQITTLLVALLLILSTSLSGCARFTDRSEHIEGVDKYYQDGKFANALDALRKLYATTGEKNRLLFLIEAGSILHTMEEWEKSNEVFEEANEIAEQLSKSMGEEFLAFFINEKQKTYIGERFEHVKIKFYLALNNLMLDKKETAFRHLRALNQDLSDIRNSGKNYQQNFAARYLGAIVAEELGNINYARVQYNNMLADSPFKDLAGQELLRLAIIENDHADIKKYETYQKNFNSYYRHLPPALINAETRFDELGSVMFIHESGIAPHKVSRGKIKNDETFQTFFKAALALAIASEGTLGVDASILLYLVGEAYNPIAQYVSRTEKNLITEPTFTLGESPALSFTPTVLDNFEQTTFHNFNDEYPKYVEKNVASIATRVLIVYTSGKAVEHFTETKEESGLGSMLSSLISIFGGAAISATLAPDLRSWNLTYNNLQMKRVFLEPGEYPLNIKENNSTPFHYRSKIPSTITIEPGKTTYVFLKSF